METGRLNFNNHTMNTRFLMTSSAFFLGIIGVILTFIPVEFLHHFNLEATKLLQLVVQTLGALYFSFAMLNWMSRGNLIGGIYNRPVAVANLTHFLIAGLALMKALIADSQLPVETWVVAGIYILFAAFFGGILFIHPVKE